MGRWLRLWFALLALFGPAVVVPEAQARPVAVSVGGAQPEAQLRWVYSRERVARRFEAAPEVAPAFVARASRPLYLLHRALLH